jgi:hypothetical protein
VGNRIAERIFFLFQELNRIRKVTAQKDIQPFFQNGRAFGRKDGNQPPHINCERYNNLKISVKEKLPQSQGDRAPASLCNLSVIPGSFPFNPRIAGINSFRTKKREENHAGSMGVGSGFLGLLRRGRRNRRGGLGPAKGMTAAPGGAAPVIQVIKEVNVSQNKAGKANQGAQALQAKKAAQELGSQKGQEQPEKKGKDRLH